MEHGFKTMNMALYGFLIIMIIFILIVPVVIGCLRNMDGLGFPVTVGVGPPFIMAGGFMIHFMVGYGFPVTIGVQLG